MSIALVTPVTPVKYCEMCSTPLWSITSNRQKYCLPCKEEAGILRYRRYNKKRSKVGQIGTTTMGQHPNPDFEIEAELVWKEKERILNVVTSYKYKGTIWKDNKNFGIVEYGSSQPLGIQQTHPQASFDDYVQTSVSIWMTSQGPCPECESGKHLKDFSRCECACECGLLLYGAPHPSFKYPDDNDENIPLCPMSHEVKNQRLFREQQNDSRMREVQRGI